MKSCSIFASLLLFAASAKSMAIPNPVMVTTTSYLVQYTEVDVTTTEYEDGDDTTSSLAAVNDAVTSVDNLVGVGATSAAGYAIGTSAVTSAAVAAAVVSSDLAAAAVVSSAPTTSAAIVAATTSGTTTLEKSAVNKNKASSASGNKWTPSTYANIMSGTSQLSPASATVSAAAHFMKDFDLSQIEGDLEDFVDPTEDFKDGIVKCSEFPAGNGVIPVPWIGYGGWTSIQSSENDLVATTSTVCGEGNLCSYACQAGMSKTQWTSGQPVDGQSRGGLRCKNGYLYRTNTDTSKLCEWGQDAIQAVNKLDDVISLCRTDYPGSENMNIPTRLTAGSTKPMSDVIEDGYYTWKGGKTSSQYYVNNAGVDVVEGCIWGNKSGVIGNWAPVVIGAGYTNGMSWLSMIPNPENKDKTTDLQMPNYDLTIEAVDGATLQGACSIINGVYSGSQGAASDGCTTSVKGKANFVFSKKGTASKPTYS